jgi:hypothetical protein
MIKTDLAVSGGQDVVFLKPALTAIHAISYFARILESGGDDGEKQVRLGLFE